MRSYKKDSVKAKTATPIIVYVQPHNGHLVTLHATVLLPDLSPLKTLQSCFVVQYNAGPTTDVIY